MTPTHTSADAAPLPRWPAVLREQLSAVGGAVRRELAAVGVLAALAALLVIGAGFYYGEGVGFELVDLTWPVVLLGLFAPTAVWKGDEPSRRGYFWALPVDRARHTLAKVLSGWAWLMALAAVYLLGGLAATLLTGGAVHSGLPARPGVDVTLDAHPWMWLLPFVGATAAYLLGSIVALSTDRPWRWYAGAFFLALVLVQVRVAMESERMERIAGAVILGRYGLNTLVTGTVTRFVLLSQDTEVAIGTPDGGAWAVAALLWLVLPLAGVVLAARRHQEG